MFQSLDKRFTAMFRKLTSDTSEHILPACLMFMSFDKHDGELLFVKYKKKDLRNFHTQLMNKIEDQLPSEAQTVVFILLEDASKFCPVLFRFMTETVVI